MSVWDTYGMKTDIILAKNWIQTSEEGDDNRCSELLFFLEKGVGYMILCFFGRSRFLVKHRFLTKNSRNGSP